MSEAVQVGSTVAAGLVREPVAKHLRDEGLARTATGCSGGSVYCLLDGRVDDWGERLLAQLAQDVVGAAAELAGGRERGALVVGPVAHLQEVLVVGLGMTKSAYSCHGANRDTSIGRTSRVCRHPRRRVPHSCGRPRVCGDQGSTTSSRRACNALAPDDVATRDRSPAPSSGSGLVVVRL